MAHWFHQPDVQWGRTGAAQLEFVERTDASTSKRSVDDEEDTVGQPCTSAKSRGKRPAPEVEAQKPPRRLEWRVARTEDDGVRWKETLSSRRIYPQSRVPDDEPIWIRPDANGRREKDHLLDSHRDFHIDSDFLTELVKEDDRSRSKRRAQEELAMGSRLTALGRDAAAFVRGARGTDIGLTHFSETSDATIPPLELDTEPWTSLVLPILQLNSRFDPLNQQHRKACLGARTAVATSFFPLIRAEDEQQDLRSPTIMAHHTGGSRHADFAFGPSAGASALIATEAGEVYEVNFEGGEIDRVCECVESNEAQPFARVRYLTAPHIGLHASERIVRLFDIRIPLLITRTGDISTESFVSDITRCTPDESLPIHVVATTRDVLWLDDRMPGGAILAWRHYREQDRTLSLTEMDDEDQGRRTVALWSRRSSHLTLLPYDGGPPASLTRSPYTIAQQKGNGGRAGVAAINAGESMMMLELDDNFGLHHRVLSRDERTDLGEVRRRRSTEALHELESRPYPIIDPKSMRQSRLIDMSSIRDQIFDLDEPATDTPPAFELNDASDRQIVMDRQILTLDSLAALASLNADKLPSSLIFARNRPRLQASQLRKLEESIDLPWSLDITSSLNDRGRRIIAPDAPRDLDHVDEAAVRLRERYSTGDESLAATACDQLALDLAASTRLTARQPVTQPPPVDADARPRLLGEVELLKETEDDLLDVTISALKLNLQANAGTKLLLSSWSLGEDPRNVRYRDPYGVLLVQPSSTEDDEYPVTPRDVDLVPSTSQKKAATAADDDGDESAEEEQESMVIATQPARLPSHLPLPTASAVPSAVSFSQPVAGTSRPAESSSARPVVKKRRRGGF